MRLLDRKDAEACTEQLLPPTPSSRIPMTDQPSLGSYKMNKSFLLLLFLVAAVSWVYIFYFDGEATPILLLKERKVGAEASQIIYGQRTKDDHALIECHLNEYPDGWSDSAIDIVNVDKDPIKDCNRSFRPVTELVSGRVVIVNATVASSIACRARAVFFTSDKSWDAGEWHDLSENFTFTRDFVHVQCTKNKANFSANFYEFIHTQIYRNRSAAIEAERTQLKEKEEKRALRPNVHIFVLDSVGNTAGIRSLPHTTNYLRDTFDAVNFRHVNKVGENSNPNGAAFLLNFLASDLDRSLLHMPSVPADQNASYFCNTPLKQEQKFILRDFVRQRGYASLWSEDYASLFSYPNCAGFEHQPVDHYMKPFYKLYWSSAGAGIKATQSEKNCYETYHFQLEYFQQFLEAYPDVPRTSMTWMADLGHEGNERVFHADATLHAFFERNREELDNSFIFFMSDHGMRWGSIMKSDIGKIEINSVMLFATVPKWLRSNLKLFEQMRSNSGELLSQFDIHATLLDLIESLPASNFTDFAALPPSNASRGHSIFRPLSLTPRNCFTLPIPFEYCLCQLEMVDIKDDCVNEQAGTAVAKRINEVLAAQNLSSICSELAYDKVTEAKVVSATDGLFRFSVKMRPGGGEFEAWLRDVGQRDKPFFVPATAAFTRSNSYGKDADCVTVNGAEAVRPYCYCKKRI